MATPQQTQPAFYVARPLSLVRLLYFTAFACALIAALIFGGIIDSAGFNDAFAWLAGGFASAWLAVAV
jgi:hypothetical protein